MLEKLDCSCTPLFGLPLRAGSSLRQGCQASHKVRPGPLIAEDGAALDPPHHHVVEDARRIRPRAAWHGGIIRKSDVSSKVP